MLINPAWGNRTESPLRHVTHISERKCEMCFQEPGRRFQTTTTTTTSGAGSTRLEFGEVRKLHAIRQEPEYSSRQLSKSVIVKSLGGVKVGESSCSFQDGSETAQHGCRPEVAEHPFSSAQTLAWPVWTDTGFTGFWRFDDEFTCSSSEFGWDGEQSVKRLRIRGEKQHWDLSGG